MNVNTTGKTKKYSYPAIWLARWKALTVSKTFLHQI